MKDVFRLSKKTALYICLVIGVNFVNAQTVIDGINEIDGYRFGKAKEIYSAIVEREPSDANYFYLGNVYLAQFEPDFDKAEEYFRKGLSLNEKKSYFGKIGIASIKLGKGDKEGAIEDFNAIAKSSRERDPEVLYRIGEALSIYSNNNNPKLAIEFLNKAIRIAEKKKKGVPEYYYYTLGDANRLEQSWGKAMTAYETALETAENKAAAYSRIGSLWTSAKQWERAKSNIDKAIEANPDYAPAYKARGAFNIIYQKYEDAARDYKQYLDLADLDPGTILDYSRLAFLARDYKNAESALESVFNEISDPVKYRVKAYLLYQKRDFEAAKENLYEFFAKTEKSRIIPSDYGLEGLIIAGLATKDLDNVDMERIEEAQQKIAIAKEAEDETLNWDIEFAIAAGASISNEGGITSPEIEDLKNQVSENPRNTDLLYRLAYAYQNVENWGAAAYNWAQMASILKTWEPAYYYLGYALQKNGSGISAVIAYQKYVDVLSTKSKEEQEKNKELLSVSYYNMANIMTSSDINRSLEYINKAHEVNPEDSDIINLKQSIENFIANQIQTAEEKS